MIRRLVQTSKLRFAPCSFIRVRAIALVAAIVLGALREIAAAPPANPESTSTVLGTTATTPPASIPASDPGYTPAGILSSRLAAKLYYDPLTGYGLIERVGARLTFARGVPWVIFDWTKALPIEPPVEGERGLSFSAQAASIVERAFAESESADRSAFSVAAVLIDPGHGGKDPGAIGEHLIAGKKLRVVEKDIALSVSLRLRDKLKAKYPDKRILVTREGDSYPTLEDRVDMANAVELAPNEAIVYLSIHANSSFNKNAKGFEVWYLNPDYRRTLVDPKKPGGPAQEIAPILNAMLEEEFTTESIILARNIMSEMQASLGAESPNRGIRAEKWFVVRNARMPSVLVETGFVTNPEEGKLLASDDYLARVTDGVYNGITDFVSYFESMRGAPSQ